MLIDKVGICTLRYTQTFEGRNAMAKSTKCRRVCGRPAALRFMPDARAAEILDLSLEELESLRLCDLEGLDQETAARRMEVSRGTLQRIIYSAHAKVAEALCTGKGIFINGGNYEIAGEWCGGMARCRRCPFIIESDRAFRERMERIMRNGIIAVTAEENGEIFQHFGHTRWFALYEIKEGAVASHRLIDAEGSGHSALGGFLKENGVDLLICGGIGGGAKNVLAAAGIELVSGVSGSIDEAVKAFLAGRLKDDPAAECDHHHHGEIEGSCHGCGHGEAHGCH